MPGWCAHRVWTARRRFIEKVFYKSRASLLAVWLFLLSQTGLRLEKQAREA